MIEVKNLKKYFLGRGGFLEERAYVRAVDGVSFSIMDGESFGLVGESGCGKTTLGRLLLRLTEPTSGEVQVDGRDLFRLEREELRSLRKNMQIVFQDTFSSLNPRMVVEEIVSEPLENFGIAAEKSAVLQLLESMGLKAEHMQRYPHELSGGERQRVAIARALILNPKFLVFDEPTSALDVSVQAQILNLINELRHAFGISSLFISHDLLVINRVAERVAVMYLGKFVEVCEKNELFSRPLHPYTQVLLSAIPIHDPKFRTKKRVSREAAKPNPAQGCSFYGRCTCAQPRCAEEEPRLIEASKGHFVACFLHYCDSKSASLAHQLR